MKRILYTFIFTLLIATLSFAGNPDRQGEAGAGELLLNPWATSAGLHSMTTSFVSGVDALRINPAGIGRLSGREVYLANTRLYEGSTLQHNAVGYAQRGKGNGAFGFSLAIVDFGDITITTEDQPEGTGGFYSPSFVNLGMGYSYTYENKISVGILARMISETLPNLSAFGMAVDAGVQYVSGEKENFKLGISLRNIGTPMRFSGEGLSRQIVETEGQSEFPVKIDTRAESFDLPSVLNIGFSYDFYLREDIYIRGLANFTSNAFSRDQIGGGVELHYGTLITLRGGYKYEIGSELGSSTSNVYTGAAAGASINVPFKTGSSSKLGIDYAYRTTSPFRGTHNFGIRLTF